MTEGPRFTGGYQFPRTDAAALKRERPLLSERGIGACAATIELVPLTGAREPAWDLCARWTEPMDAGEQLPGGAVDLAQLGAGAGERPGRSVSWSFLCRGDDEATVRAAFAEVVEGFRSGVFPGLLPG